MYWMQCVYGVVTKVQWTEAAIGFRGLGRDLHTSVICVTYGMGSVETTYRVFYMSAIREGLKEHIGKCGSCTTSDAIPSKVQQRTYWPWPRKH